MVVVVVAAESSLTRFAILGSMNGFQAEFAGKMGAAARVEAVRSENGAAAATCLPPSTIDRLSRSAELAVELLSAKRAGGGNAEAGSAFRAVPVVSDPTGPNEDKSDGAGVVCAI